MMLAAAHLASSSSAWPSGSASSALISTPTLAPLSTDVSGMQTAQMVHGIVGAVFIDGARNAVKADDAEKAVAAKSPVKVPSILFRFICGLPWIEPRVPVMADP